MIQAKGKGNCLYLCVRRHSSTRATLMSDHLHTVLARALVLHYASCVPEEVRVSFNFRRVRFD